MELKKKRGPEEKIKHYKHPNPGPNIRTPGRTSEPQAEHPNRRPNIRTAGRTSEPQAYVRTYVGDSSARDLAKTAWAFAIVAHSDAKMFAALA